MAELERFEVFAGRGVPLVDFRTGSDCEVLIPLYLKYGLEGACAKLRGMFSFILYDQRTGFYGAARDHIGITSLYIGRGPDGSVWIASELKAMARDCPSLEQFKPGHCWRSDTKDFVEWYKPEWRALEGLPATPCDYTKLREAFEKAVERRMMSDVPWGVLLSGGLDSSLVASVAQRFLKKKVAAGAGQWMSALHSFSVGLVGSPDLAAAAKAAAHIGTIHHPYTFTLQEGLDAVAEVVHHLETYDVTTIRAATPMFLMARKIKAMGVKMVLSGEGADEILAGYLYFHKAPDGAAQESELPNFKGSFLGRFPLVSADCWTSDHLSERPRSVGAFSGTRARGTLTLKRRCITLVPPRRRTPASCSRSSRTR